MPTINNISISDAEFTAMQELATAFICERAFKDNKEFTSPESIIKDKATKKGLEDIFTYRNKPLLQFTVPIDKKTVEGKWINTFYLQQQRLLKEFSNAKFTVFNRDGGFMQFITDLIKDKFGISRKDAWDPADIWLIKDSPKFRNKIAKELEGARGTQTIKELNAIMRSMFQKREIVGVSLKLISGTTARYEEVNVTDAFFKKLENMQGEYDFKTSKIVCKLNLKNKNQFATQDTIIFIKDTTKDIAKFQIKGNTPSRLANLKFEGTEIGASAARLGKAPLNLVEKLSAMVDKELYNSETKQNGNYPTTAAEYQKVQTKYEKMFEILAKSKLVKDLGIKNKKEFSNNMIKVFKGPEPQIANQKLMQVYFVQRLLSLKEQERDEYLTDLLFLSQKKGAKVFDFGPFGKLY
tara:strand:+ start:76 stop:1302 length:1227 start_codon:yes stop_codon:yes gene_type:complete